VPIFDITPNLMHSCTFEHLNLTHSAMQTVAAGSTFNVSGSTGTDLYNCVWANIRANNYYNFMQAPSCLWWGNTFRDCWFGDQKNGVTNIQGATGEPRNLFENLYIGAGSTTGSLFSHNACYCHFLNVEVNGANSGATMISDSGGGYYVIDHFALEQASYNSGTYNLFNILNGGLDARFIYTTALSINTGVSVYLLNNNNNAVGRWKLDWPYVAFGTNNGNYYLSNSGSGNRPIEFTNVANVPFGSACALTNVVSTTGPDGTVVHDWNSMSRVAWNGDADVTLSVGAEMTQIYDLPLTANRVLTLPEGRQQSNNCLFTGRRFRISRTRNSTGAFTLTIKNKAGSAVATIASSTSSFVEVAWSRTTNSTNHFGWTILDQHTY
jgi:hypothetical protein